MKNILLLILCSPFASNAQLQPARIFSDHMILQRDKPLHIWGRGIPGMQVSVSFAKNNASTNIEDDSTWSITLPAQSAQTIAQVLYVRSVQKTFIFRDVLVGDIWICTGQSNMEFPLSSEMHFSQQTSSLQQPLIRLNNPAPVGRNVYGVAYTDSMYQRLTRHDFYEWKSWLVCDSVSAPPMSAVAYYFAKKIVQETGVPIGLINLSIGGAPLETFISADALKQDPVFSAKLQGNWLYNDALPQWVRERGKQNVGANPSAFQDEFGPHHAYKPGFAFAAGVEPLLPLPVRGVLLYQGESNSLEMQSVQEYKKLMLLLIRDYRKKWQSPSMPFYWVQLSSIDTTKYQSRYWPMFRDEQRKLLKEVSHGGMAVSSDIGNKTNVHPTNKKDVGERLARWALRDVYHQKIVPSGPLPLQAKFSRNKVVIRFQYAQGLHASGTTALRGFSVDGLQPAPAKIKGRFIEISTLTKPVFVYYAWQPFTDANLVNADHLPASTFKLTVQ